MGQLKISICDWCGKRTEVFEGRLTLTREFKDKKYYESRTKTERSWRLCKRCFNKLCGVETNGDIIYQDLELLVDKFRAKKNVKLISSDFTSPSNDG